MMNPLKNNYHFKKVEPSKLLQARLIACLVIVGYVLCIMVLPPATAYQYNETNLTEYQVMPHISIPNTPLEFTAVNGNGTLQYGYVPTVARVQGMDTVIQFLIVITVFLGIIMFLMVIYVGTYIWRYLGGD